MAYSNVDPEYVGTNSSGNLNFEGTGAITINDLKAGKGSVITSALNSITKVEVFYGTSGSNRGLDVYALGDDDSDWVQVLSGKESKTGGYSATIDVDRENCQLKFVSADDSNYVFLVSLAIYGNVSSESEGGTTGISNAIVSSNVENGVIYNLAGQRLSKLTKGINIVNGKKIFVK